MAFDPNDLRDQIHDSVTAGADKDLLFTGMRGLLMAGSLVATDEEKVAITKFQDTLTTLDANSPEFRESFHAFVGSESFKNFDINTLVGSGGSNPEMSAQIQAAVDHLSNTSYGANAVSAAFQTMAADADGTLTNREMILAFGSAYEGEMKTLIGTDTGDALFDKLQQLLGIQWHYDEIGQDAEATETEGTPTEASEQDESFLDKIDPPSEFLEEIVDLVNKGDLNGVRVIAETFGQENFQYRPLTKLIAQKADEFEDDEILNIIQRYQAQPAGDL